MRQQQHWGGNRLACEQTERCQGGSGQQSGRGMQGWYMLSLEEYSEYFVLYLKKHGCPQRLKTMAVTCSSLGCGGADRLWPRSGDREPRQRLSRWSRQEARVPLISVE